MNISNAKISEWKCMTDLNQHNEVRVDICNYLSNECKANGKCDMFKPYRKIYEAIAARSEDGLSFEDDCMRYGCDAKMIAMVDFIDHNAAVTIKGCL